jgi:outer membrane cobalamin receptor
MKRGISLFTSQLLLIAGLLPVSNPANGADIFELSLEKLMSLPIEGVSNTYKPISEQPGIVTVITQQQIEQSGARYLMDLVKQVPGFWVGTDTIGTLSVSFRGIWGMEAKILLIIDDIEQNELAFGSLVLGNRYPVSTFEKVEIIRGPGSVKYGSQAALAVIKVTTKGSHTDINYVSLGGDFNEHGTYNQTFSALSSGLLNPNKDVSSSWRYSSSFSVGQGDYSDKSWRALDGYEVELKGNTNSQPINLNIGMQNTRQRVRILYDRFKQDDQLLFGDSGRFYSPNNAYTQNNTLSFENLNIQAEQSWDVNSPLKVSAKFTYTKQKPWNFSGQYNHNVMREAERSRVDITGFYALSDQHNLAAGFMYYDENETVSESFLFDASQRFNGRNTIQQTDHALYLQYEQQSEWANISVGARYENHEAAGDQFLPRLAVTKTKGNFHGKLVYNKAFKIPQMDTLASAKNAGTEIVNIELSTTSELEFGYRITPQLNIKANVFLLEINNFIGFNPSTASNATLGKLSAYGQELEINWLTESIKLNTSYSLFMLKDTNIDSIMITNESNEVIGIPNHMLKLNGRYLLSNNHSIHVIGSMISSRHACVEDNSFICGTPKHINEEYEFNVFYRHKDSLKSYNIGIANIFDTDSKYTQPYRGGQSPISGLSRRLMFDITYDL